MFKKFFGRKESPTNEGKFASPEKVESVRWVKKFSLQLTNMEGSPAYALTHQLSVGSEVGNIVISDPSVSPRHCTFVLQEDVVSVLDHASVEGTFINGTKIPPGRYIILEESDSIRVGDLELKILTANEAADEDVEELNSPPEIDTLEEDEEVEETEEVVDEEQEEAVEERAPKVSFFKKYFSKKAKSKSKPVVAQNSHYATNSLVRLIAVLCDLMIAYSLYIILHPFDEFRAFLSDIPSLLGSLLNIDWNAFIDILNEEHAFVGEALKDLSTLFTGTIHIAPVILLFFCVRAISTVILGISLSEGILGVKSLGNPIWNRVGGLLRVMVGMITGPFIVFDLPAVISRRTFKEFMTFTHTYLHSKFITILGVILYFPLMVGVVLLAPLLQGLELPEPIALNEKMDVRVKVARAEDALPEVMAKDSSNFLNLDIEYDVQNVTVVPSYKFSGAQKKINFRPSLTFYHNDIQRSAQLEMMKKFDLKELLRIGMKGDFFLSGKFPEIESFINASDQSDKSFKKKDNNLSNRKFADEIISFSKIAFELNANNAFETMQTYTPFLKGLMDYRSSFLALIEYKEFDQIDFVKLGDSFFLRISYTRQKPFDLIIPLIKGEGRILRIDFDKKENLGLLRNKFYKYTLDKTGWFSEIRKTLSEDTLSPFQVLDFFTSFDSKEISKIPADRAQALYGYYFEKSADILTKDDPILYGLWKKSVNSVLTIMERMKESIPKPSETVVEAPPIEEVPTDLPTTPEIIEDPRIKLFNNFQDLQNAVETKNRDYFGIESTSV